MIRALIADDHAVVRRGLKELLTDSQEVSVIGEAATGREVLDQVRRADWDVVVLDINLPDQNGLDVLRAVKRERPRLPVLVLTICSEDLYAMRALRAGAAGYLTKESAPEELLGAIRKAVMGGRYIGPSLAERLAQQIARAGEDPPHEALSDREFEVFRMLASGKTASQAAEALHLSVKTISTYRARLLEKMGMRTNADLTVYAVRNSLIE
ncbi:MAG TPA: response regulator transcription factor [Candidatus Limnocylindrales bacterium]|nr:response regulator transcription factor [Candidatus Limnocylindrales bacterium]